MKTALLGDGKGNLQITDKEAIAQVHPTAQLLYARLNGDPNHVIQVVAVGAPLINDLVIRVVQDTAGTYVYYGGNEP